MPKPNALDGRWISLAIVAIYFGALAWSGPIETMRSRWKHAGLHATGPSFLDLRLFPAAQSEFAAGGNPYVSNPSDPKQRPYNYPRIWLSFMRFPADDRAITSVGFALALLALITILTYWGRLTASEGIYGGTLLCTPAVMLGVEKGNTDLFILTLVALGLIAVGRESPTWRRSICVVTWLSAAILKLFPILIFAAWPARNRRDWAKGVAIPFIVFLVYLAVTASDVSASLRNTGLGWIQAYGARIPVLAAEMALPYYGRTPIDIERWSMIATAATVAVFALAALRGWRHGSRHNVRASNAVPGITAGFQSGALIYCATYLAGANFDYRQCFLLLTLPQLFRWIREPGAFRGSARAVLGALLLSCGVNFVIAGWTGFFINEIAGLFLGAALAGMLAATWSRTAIAPIHERAL
jgi:hypothetical protein